MSKLLFIFRFVVRITYFVLTLYNPPYGAFYDAWFLTSWLAACLFFTYARGSTLFCFNWLIVVCLQHFYCCPRILVHTYLLVLGFHRSCCLRRVQVLRTEFALSGKFTETINVAFVMTNAFVYLFFAVCALLYFFGMHIFCPVFVFHFVY